MVAEPLSLALLDVPSSSGLGAGDPTILIAATAAHSWQRQPVQINCGAQTIMIDPARTKSIVGQAEAALAPAATELIDLENEVTIALSDEEQWLTS